MISTMANQVVNHSFSLLHYQQLGCVETIVKTGLAISEIYPMIHVDSGVEGRPNSFQKLLEVTAEVRLAQKVMPPKDR